MAKILIVDDDGDILKIIKDVLSSAKHKVFTALNVPEAHDLLKSVWFDLIITDIKMPNHSGFDFVESLRKSKKFNSLPVVMLTGLRGEKDVQKALRIGVDDYIIKPFDALLVLNKIQHVLKKKPERKIPEIEFTKISSSANAEINLKVKLISLSEEGVEFECSHKLEESEVIDMQSSIFNEMRLPHLPHLRSISSTQMKGKNAWKIYCSFFGMNEDSLQKIRAWIYSQQLKTKH